MDGCKYHVCYPIVSRCLFLNTVVFLFAAFFLGVMFVVLVLVCFVLVSWFLLFLFWFSGNPYGCFLMR